MLVSSFNFEVAPGAFVASTYIINTNQSRQNKRPYKRTHQYETPADPVHLQKALVAIAKKDWKTAVAELQCIIDDQQNAPRIQALQARESGK